MLWTFLCRKLVAWASNKVVKRIFDARYACCRMDCGHLIKGVTCFLMQELVECDFD